MPSSRGGVVTVVLVYGGVTGPIGGRGELTMAICRGGVVTIVQLVYVGVTWPIGGKGE